MTSAFSHDSHKVARKLACVRCQSRKKKCDRHSPCTSCLKVNAVCTPSTPAPPRKRRQPTRDLLERLARCEELLKHCTCLQRLENLPSTPKASEERSLASDEVHEPEKSSPTSVNDVRRDWTSERQDH